MKLPVDDYQLPSDWQVVQASELAEFTRGMSWRKVDESSPPDGVQVISIPNIRNGFIDYDSKYNHFVSKEVPEAKRLRLGDILFVGSSGSVRNVGRSAMIRALPADVVTFASFTVRARFTDRAVNNEFLYYLLNSEFTPFEWFSKRAADGKFNFQLRQFTAELRLPLPPPAEQRRIAALLTAVRQAIEQEEHLIARTTELKNALMHKLFRTGLNGVSPKESEIGEIPMDWEVQPLGELLKLTQYGLSIKGSDDGTYPILRMTNQLNGKISPADLQWVQIGDDEFEKFCVKRGDVLFNRTNSFELVGRTAIFDLEGDYVFASYLIRLVTDTEQLNPFFLNHYFNFEDTQQRMKTIATRAVSQSNISATRLKGFQVPVPPLSEQAEIITMLDILDGKSGLHQRALSSLQSMFSTLLHDLMTANLRVADLDTHNLPSVENAEVNSEEME